MIKWFFFKNCQKTSLATFGKWCVQEFQKGPYPSSGQGLEIIEELWFLCSRHKKKAAFHCDFSKCAQIHYLTWFLPWPCEVGRTIIIFSLDHFSEMPRSYILHNYKLTDLALLSHANKTWPSLILIQREDSSYNINLSWQREAWSSEVTGRERGRVILKNLVVLLLLSLPWAKYQAFEWGRLDAKTKFPYI